MSILHTLKTDKKYPAFKHIKTDYTVSITYSLCNDEIDIHVANVKPQGSDLTFQVSPQMFPALARHYHSELDQCSRDEIYQQTVQLKALES